MEKDSALCSCKKQTNSRQVVPSSKNKTVGCVHVIEEVFNSTLSLKISNISEEGSYVMLSILSLHHLGSWFQFASLQP